jgi:hypothetical protein
MVDEDADNIYYRGCSGNQYVLPFLYSNESSVLPFAHPGVSSCSHLYGDCSWEKRIFYGKELQDIVDWIANMACDD